MTNPYGKTVKTPYRENAYEIWVTPDYTWKWYVLKKYQLEDTKPNARWFCLVESPFVPEGELGDVYASEVMDNARRIK